MADEKRLLNRRNSNFLPENSSYMTRYRLTETCRLLPVIIATVVTITVLAAGNCMYESNDDMGMIQLIAGKLGLTATPDAIFLSLPLSSLLYLFYKTVPALPWYGILMYGLLFTGCISGIRAIFRSAGNEAAKIICLSVLLACYSYLIYRLNFAAASLFLWVTTAAAIAADNLNNTPVSARSWIYGTLFGISYLVRPDLQFMVITLGFSIPLAATFLFTQNRSRRLIAAATPLLLAIMIATGAAMLYRSSPEYESFASYNIIRSEYLDTARSFQNSQTGRALIATGWTPADYMMAGSWWLHDGNIFSGEKLALFMQNNSKPTALASLATLKIAISQNLPLIAMIVLALLPVALFKTNNESFSARKSLILAGSFSLTVLALLVVMAIRFPTRIAIPLFANLMLCGTLLLPHISGGWIRSATARTFITLFSVSATCYIIFVSATELSREGKQLKLIKQSTGESIATIQRQIGADAVFLCANVINENAFFNLEAVSPLKEYRGSPDFINFPIGSLIASPPYNSFLRKYGFVDRYQAVPKMIDNRKLVLAYWCQNQSFEEYEERFLIHLNDNYAAMFPGKKILLEPVLDRRNNISRFGWVFFRIITLPKTAPKEVVKG